MRLRRWLIALALASAAVVAVNAQLQYVATQVLQVDTTTGGVKFSSNIITPVGDPRVTQATTASCRLELSEIRWTISPDQTVTATTGTLLETGDWLVIKGHDSLVNFRAIQTGSGAAKSGQLDCTISTP